MIPVRDAKIDEETAQRKSPGKGNRGTDVQPHATTSAGKGGKPVTDPVTGKTVEVLGLLDWNLSFSTYRSQIADVGKDFVRNAKDPHVRMRVYSKSYELTLE